MNDVFRQRLCTLRLYWGRGNLGYWDELLLWIMPLVQDRTLDLLTSSLVRYQCDIHRCSFVPLRFSVLWTSLNLAFNLKYVLLYLGWERVGRHGISDIRVSNVFTDWASTGVTRSTVKALKYSSWNLYLVCSLPA